MKKYTKEQFLAAAKLGEVNMIDAKHIVSRIDEIEDEDENILQKAISKFGMKNQMDMCQEECAELIVAINKYKRNGSGKSITSVCEEIADTEIMLEQMKLIFPSEIIQKFKEAKIKRLEQRINSLK